MKYLNIIILLLLTTSFYSCNDYLDVSIRTNAPFTL